jgi:hypothetical protein
MRDHFIDASAEALVCEIRFIFPPILLFVLVVGLYFLPSSFSPASSASLAQSASIISSKTNTAPQPNIVTHNGSPSWLVSSPIFLFFMPPS